MIETRIPIAPDTSTTLTDETTEHIIHRKVTIKIDRDYLRKKYENVLQITYPNLISKQITNNTKADVGFEKLSSLELFEQFYEKIKGSKLDKEAKALVAEILKEEHNSDTK